MALKILEHGSSRRELDIMRRMSDKQGIKGLPNEYVVELLDYFEHKGPNGTHLCLVLEVLCQDVLDFLEGYSADSPSRLPLVKQISKQVLEGLEFLHACGVIHNGRRESSV